MPTYLAQSLRLSTVAIAFGCIVATSVASIQETQAWRRTFNTGAFDDKSIGIQTDVSGYGYFEYVDAQPGNFVSHLVKMGPSMNVGFDITNTFPIGFVPTGALVSPVISGKQFVYVTGEQVDGSGNKSVWIKKYDTAGNPQWGGAPEVFSSAVPGDDLLVGMHAQNNGDFYFVTDELDGSGHHFARMRMLAAANAVVFNDNALTNMQPQFAIYNNANDQWIVGGIDLVSSRPFSARWGTYNAVSGQIMAGEQVDGYANPQNGAFVKRQYIVDIMKSGALGIIRNTLTASSGAATPVPTYFLERDSGSISFGWRYPDGGPEGSGLVIQMENNDFSSPVYVVGQTGPTASPHFLMSFGFFSGTVAFTKTNQPIDLLFPTPEGFYSLYHQSSTNTNFLEHFDGATAAYDYGKTFAGTGSGTNAFAGFAPFQNSFYVLNNLSNTSTGFDVVLDRFVFGTAFQNMTCASSVQAGHTLGLTIHLNANAPSGGVSVGLNSNSTKLLMPNGTRSQTFTVPSGSSTLLVNLSAQTVASSTRAVVLGISNGIRRQVATTVTP